MPVDAPQISVVIPLYNKESYIKRCLDSILSQTYKQFEVIVIDDGSTDQGKAIVQSFTDKRIHLHSFPNAGVSVARNTGIGFACADWVALCDADDEWHPNFLSEITQGINRFPTAIVLTTAFELDSGKQSIGVNVSDSFVIPDYVSSIIESGNAFKATCSSTAFRRDAACRAGLFPAGIKKAEDLDFWMRLSWLGPFVYIPQVLAYYHEQCLDNAHKKPRQSGPEHPPMVTSFRRWLKQNRIPECKQLAGAKYVLREIHKHSRAMLTTRRRWQGFLNYWRHRDFACYERKSRYYYAMWKCLLPFDMMSIIPKTLGLLSIFIPRKKHF